MCCIGIYVLGGVIKNKMANTSYLKMKIGDLIKYIKVRYIETKQSY